MISHCINQVVIASLFSSLLTVSFILLRKKLLKLIGARWTYYLWFSLLIPWIAVVLPINLFSFRSSAIGHVIANYNITQDQAVPVYIDQFYRATTTLIIWVVGSLCSLGYLLFKHIQFESFIKTNSQLLTRKQKSIIKNVLVIENFISLSIIFLSKAVSSPMICHLFKSKIYLPDKFFVYYTQTEQKYILQHECVHYQRCDLIANLGMLILVCLNWFNPIILLSYRYFRNAQELSCDAILSEKFSPSQKKAYGYALLKNIFNQPSQFPAMTCWWNSGKQLKERCYMLKFHRSRPIKNILGLTMFAIATTVAVAAPNFETQDTRDLKISNSSKYQLTLSIENICSAELGVINSHTIKVINHQVLSNACRNNLSNCKAEIYASNNCSGSLIGIIKFDMSYGIKYIETHMGEIAGSGFNLFVKGPWVDRQTIESN